MNEQTDNAHGNQPSWGKRLPFPLGYIESLLGIGKLRKIYSNIPPTSSPYQFAEETLRAFSVNYGVCSGDLEAIPRSGPAIVVSNHPFGGLDGLVLLDLLSRIRPDVKALVNYYLGTISELRDAFIFVDPFGGERARRKNVTPLREAIRWVENGGLLFVFPSGTVSHLQLSSFQVTDPTWDPLVGRLIQRTSAPVVPVFFAGGNSWFFQLAGLIHPRARTALLPRELLKKAGSRIELHLGRPIARNRWNAFQSDRELVEYLRLRTYVLRTRASRPRKSSFIARFSLMRRKFREKEIIPAIDPLLLHAEVEKLPPRQTLIEHEEYRVVYARASQIPHCLREIGRLREVTFREVDEGTGRSLDLDRFDNYYLHLFTWNTRKREIIGSYRLGRTDLIVKHFGISGLYTNSLFHYKAGLLEQLGPSLELGRSFVRREYQKNYTSLLLLWKGIAHFVVQHPRYRMLFGSVSISSNYDSLSRHLIAEFLKQNSYCHELAQLVKPRNPWRSGFLRAREAHRMTKMVKDIHDVGELILDIEEQEQSIPVLLRQYLKLGGRLLGFNIDQDFGGVLDGLILVDLLNTDHKVFERYMSKAGLQSFLAHHGVVTPPLPESGRA